MWNDLSSVESFREKIELRLIEIRQKLSNYRKAMWRQRFPNQDWENIPDEISCPDVVGSEHKLRICGVYDMKKGIKGALEMLDWRNHCYVDDLLPAIIVAFDDKLAVYSCE